MIYPIGTIEDLISDGVLVNIVQFLSLDFACNVNSLLLFLDHVVILIPGLYYNLLHVPDPLQGWDFNVGILVTDSPGCHYYSFWFHFYLEVFEGNGFITNV